MASVSQELMRRISRNFIFGYTSGLVAGYQLLMKIAVQVAELFYFLHDFLHELISVSNPRNHTKIFMRNILIKTDADKNLCLHNQPREGAMFYSLNFCDISYRVLLQIKLHAGYLL